MSASAFTLGNSKLICQHGVMAAPGAPQGRMIAIKRYERSAARLSRSRLPKSIKRLFLVALFTAGTLAGYWGAELRTSAGVDHQSRVTFDTASNGTGSYAAANYIAVTENATAPASGDTALTGELTTEGFARAQASYGHTNGTTTTTLSKTFTMSGGTSRTLNKAGLFNASSSGTLSYSTLVPSPPTLVSGDQVAFTWTFTF